MTTVWKLTNADLTTRNDTLWGEGITHTAPGGGPLCSAAWVHAYASPLLAVLMDPIHGDFGADAMLWRCDAEVGRDDGTKLGCTSLTTVERVPLPVVTTEQRVHFGILAAWEVCDDPGWRAWAGKWLDGTDRSARAVRAAARAAEARAALDLVAIAERACGGEG